MAADIEHLSPEFRTRLLNMINASGGRLTINSGYRSVAEQAGLWNAAVAKYGAEGARKWVAPPGHSKHGEGVAVDLGGDLDWAHAHAAEFGLYFPMQWEPWHIQPIGVDGNGGGGDPRSGMTTPPAAPQKPRTIADGLSIVASLIPGTKEGAAPSVTPTAPTVQTMNDTQTQDQTQPAQPAQAGGGAAAAGGANPGGDVKGQLKAGFASIGRQDLADMVDTPDFDAWINAESGWDPSSVSPANNHGQANGGLFQFWFGHDWARQYNQGGSFNMSPYDQAIAAATHFNLTPDRIRGFASQIHAGHYMGWG